jgi:peroxiredoxin Q/BCP
MINVGDKIPSFKVLNQDDVTVSSEQLLGKKLILFFYPKDDTPGCTAEACSLRDGFGLLTGLGYTLLGISPDTSSKHRKFIEKHSLPFQLLADTDHKMMEDFGVWGEKSMYGKKYMGVIRTTIVVDENGLITHVVSKVKTKDHSAQLLDLLS